MTDLSAGPRDPEALCPGPDPHPRGPRRFAVPCGAVDTHAHVIGLPPRWPLVANRSYTPPEAGPSAYLAMLDATGMTHGVLVQVSVHGTDNRLMESVLRAHPDRLRGIGVVGLGRSEAEYGALKAAGVVGLRVNVLFGGGVSLDGLESYGALCREMGWHLQLLLDARQLPELAPRLAKLPVPFVVDHMGHMPAAGALEQPGFRTLVLLVRDGAWVKLSGAYRLSDDAPAYPETTPMARALLEAAPERCVWGSDWPHVANWGVMPNVGDLLDLLADWAPEAALRHRVLVENPARLYGFPA